MQLKENNTEQILKSLFHFKLHKANYSKQIARHLLTISRHLPFTFKTPFRYTFQTPDMQLPETL